MAENESLILQLLQEVRDSQKKLVQQFEGHEKRAQNFEDALQHHSDESERRHQQILNAFPAGDTDGHRRYHESVIEWRELRNKIVRECLTNAAKAGFLGGSAWLLYAIWVAFKMEITRG